MYDLVKVGEHSFYMACPAKVGIVKISESDVVIIDSGSDKDAAKKVKKILDEQNWNLKLIFNTHSHADHTGGNQYLQNITGCKIYAPGIDAAVAQNPILEPVMLYGGFPMSDLRTKFLLAKESNVEKLTDDVMPDGIEIIKFPGHSYDMVGFKTKDNVVYLADTLASEDTLEKYHIIFAYDVKEYLNTLEMIKTMKADCFVPSHAEHTSDIVPLVQKNIDKTYEVIEKIKSLLQIPLTFENLLAKIFTDYNLMMNAAQHSLVGSTVRSILSYLKDEGQVEFYFENNLMMWKKA